jgi:hypothetical protein
METAAQWHDVCILCDGVCIVGANLRVCPVCLKLSDMFMDYCKEEIPNLEFIVKVININKGHNEELAQKSAALSGYDFLYS